MEEQLHHSTAPFITMWGASNIASKGILHLYRHQWDPSSKIFLMLWLPLPGMPIYCRQITLHWTLAVFEDLLAFSDWMRCYSWVFRRWEPARMVPWPVMTRERPSTLKLTRKWNGLQQPKLRMTIKGLNEYESGIRMQYLCQESPLTNL